MKNTLLLVVFVLSSYALSAQVLLISKNKKNMAISQDTGESLEVGQKVCVQSQQGKKYCGKVAKLREKSALCTMSEPLIGVAVGDSVSSEDSEGLSGGGLSEGGLSGGLSDSPEKNLSPIRREKFGLGFGIREGITFAKAYASDSSLANMKSRVGFGQGLFFDIPMDERGGLSVDIGLYYLQGKTKTDDYKMNSESINIPIFFKTRVSEGDTRPFFLGGPYLSYLTSTDYLGTFGGGEVSQDYLNYFNRLEFGIAAGLGVDFKVGKAGELGLLGVYSLGLTNVNKSSESGSDATIKSRGLQFFLQYTVRG